MLTFTFFAALAPALAMALPQTTSFINEPTTGGVNPTFPTNITITYYQGVSSAASCGTSVATGALEADTCTQFCTMGIAISQVPSNNCTFTLYQGSSTCEADANQTSTNAIPAGEGEVCIEVGVEDGCDFQYASGVWSCS